jgi:thiosulfate/3-mercaptopyruvate sulfurtransferase
MTNIKSAIAALAVFLLSAAVAQADVISAQEVKTLMNGNEDLVIIDANNYDHYRAVHLEGAVNIFHTSLYQKGDVAGLVKSPKELADILGKQGISESSNIVIYDDRGQLYASRIYWILKYLGAEKVSVLHKDTDAWCKAGLPLATTPTRVNSVTFKPDPDPDLYASTEYVRDHKDDPNVVLVDVRTPAEYVGTAPNSEGHIEGAVNINFTDLLTEKGDFKDASELAAIAEANGISPEKEVIFYCRTSVRGSVSFTAFESILGYDNVRLYDGAYVEWTVSNPVVQ